jgi:hypothetical protein
MKKLRGQERRKFHMQQTPDLRPGKICRMRQRALIAILLGATLVGVRPAVGQESFLINPGARSIGLGGAFAAIADDATAALSNPAGLVQILRPEISVEFRGTASTNSLEATIEGDADVYGLGFFSFVYPAHRWSAALYSHHLASLDFAFDSTIPYTSELTIRSYSAAAAFKISERLNAGAGISSFKGARGSSLFSPRLTDSDWGFNLGLLWTVADHWRLAGFYRQGPTFETDAVRLPLDSGVTPPSSTLLDVPDVYGVGAAFQPGGGGLTLGFEIDHLGGTVGASQFGSTTSAGGTDLHFGGEYAVLKWKPVVAFRVGVWRESRGDRRANLAPDIQPIATTASTMHVAFGFGFAFRKFQLDFGADVSDATAIASLSMVISF